MSSPGSSARPRRSPTGIAEIPGVQSVETRIVKFATIDIHGFEEPVIGQLVSVPGGGQPMLNRLALRAGRLVARRTNPPRA
jgi:putative ABC transport system permease protein